MAPHSVTDQLTAIAYRWADYWANSLIDDPAMLAFIFC